MYVLPTFNLTCDIYDWVPRGDPLGVPRLTAPCNNALGRRVQVSSTGGTGDPETPGLTLTVLFPALTDVRGGACYGAWEKGDILITPAGTGRIYLVTAVEDCGKGFANEHRVAYCLANFFWGLWPTPIP